MDRKRTCFAYALAIGWILLAVSPSADARWIAAVEACTGDGSCAGWGADSTNTNFSPYFGNSSCDNNTVNFGFAVAGDNNMCTNNPEYTCEQCNVSEGVSPPLPGSGSSKGDPPDGNLPETGLRR